MVPYCYSISFSTFICYLDELTVWIMVGKPQLPFNVLYFMDYRNGSGLARDGMQHNDVMYGLLCARPHGVLALTGNPPSVFLDFGFAYTVKPMAESRLGRPLCAAMQ